MISVLIMPLVPVEIFRDSEFAYSLLYSEKERPEGIASGFSFYEKSDYLCVDCFCSILAIDGAREMIKWYGMLDIRVVLACNQVCKTLKYVHVLLYT